MEVLRIYGNKGILCKLLMWLHLREAPYVDVALKPYKPRNRYYGKGWLSGTLEVRDGDTVRFVVRPDKTIAHVMTQDGQRLEFTSDGKYEVLETGERK